MCRLSLVAVLVTLAWGSLAAAQQDVVLHLRGSDKSEPGTLPKNFPARIYIGEKDNQSVATSDIRSITFDDGDVDATQAIATVVVLTKDGTGAVLRGKLYSTKSVTKVGKAKNTTTPGKALVFEIQLKSSASQKEYTHVTLKSVIFLPVPPAVKGSQAIYPDQPYGLVSMPVRTQIMIWEQIQTVQTFPCMPELPVIVDPR